MGSRKSLPTNTRGAAREADVRFQRALPAPRTDEAPIGALPAYCRSIGLFTDLLDRGLGEVDQDKGGLAKDSATMRSCGVVSRSWS